MPDNLEVVMTSTVGEIKKSLEDFNGLYSAFYVLNKMSGYPKLAWRDEAPICVVTVVMITTHIIKRICLFDNTSIIVKYYGHGVAVSFIDFSDEDYIKIECKERNGKTMFTVESKEHIHASSSFLEIVDKACEWIFFPERDQFKSQNPLELI